MVARDEGQLPTRVLASVCEGMLAQWNVERPKHALMRNASKRQRRSQIGHRGELREQELPARSDFRGQRLVVGRYAPHGIGERTIDELKTIVRARGVCAARKAVAEQGGVKKFACVVPRERPARAIGAVKARGQADNQEPPI